MCKMIPSSDVFSLFQNFDFLGCLGGAGTKNGPKRQEILSVSFCISGTVPHMIVVFRTQHVQNDVSSNFFIFSRF